MMKKGIIFIFCLLILCLTTGCGKKVITAQDFSKILKAKGFTITDVKKQFSEVDYIEEAYVAKDEKKDYQIEFYNMKDEESAKSFYSENKKIFQKDETGSNINTNINGKHSEKYVLITDTRFKVISRVRNTVIYLNVDEKHYEEVKDIIKIFGY